MKIILAIAGLICTGIGTGLFLLLLKPSLDANNILKNGVETSATLIDVGSSMSKGSEAYYWVKLSFVNAAGETITYKTKSLYPAFSIKSQGIAEYTYTLSYVNAAGETITRKTNGIIPKSHFDERGITNYQYTEGFEVTEEPVPVMYMGDKAVLKEYVPKEYEDWTNWLAPGLFGGVGVLLLLGLALAPAVERYAVVAAVVSFLLFAFIGFVFAGVGAGVYLWALKPPVEAAKILKKGVETTATVIAAESKVAVNDKPKYYLILSYANAKGETVTYKTNSMYDKSFLRNLKIPTKINTTTGKYDEQQVQVMCHGAKAVVKGYVPEKTETFLWIFPIVFGTIGAAIWLALIWGIVKTTGELIIKLVSGNVSGMSIGFSLLLFLRSHHFH